MAVCNAAMPEQQKRVHDTQTFCGVLLSSFLLVLYIASKVYYKMKIFLQALYLLAPAKQKTGITGRFFL
jgi:hypothetical protein